MELKNNSDKPHTFYICYFGLREPLVQTQVLPYLREIAKSGIKVSLITFEINPKAVWTPEQVESEQKKMADEGIKWYRSIYHKRPSVPATFYDILNGARLAVKMIRREKVDVLHARSYVPAMIGVLAKKLSGGRVKVLFDMRGFMPEEYTEGGMWKPDGKIYRTVKKVERWLFRESDAFIILTEKAREILFPESRENGFDKFGRAVGVIPCCVDLKRFESANEASRQKMRQKLGLENRRVIVYVGSLTSDWYMPAEIADLFDVAKRQRAETFALILTQSRVEAIKPLLSERGYTENDFLIRRVSPAEIPIYLSAADAAVSFIKPCFSKLGSSPTKNAEYLACGLPMITNSGVGDTAEMVLEDNVGVVIEEFNTESYEKALAELEKLLEDKNDLTERCKNSARKWFDLETVGGKRYLDIYHRLLKGDSDRR